MVASKECTNFLNSFSSSSYLKILGLSNLAIPNVPGVKDNSLCKNHVSETGQLDFKVCLKVKGIDRGTFSS